MTTFSFYHIHLSPYHYIGLHEGYSSHIRIQQHLQNAWNRSSPEYHSNLSEIIRLYGIDEPNEMNWIELGNRNFAPIVSKKIPYSKTARQFAEDFERNIINEAIEKHGRDVILNEKIKGETK